MKHIREVNIDEVTGIEHTCWSQQVVGEFEESGFTACEVELPDDLSPKNAYCRLRNYLKYRGMETPKVMRRKNRIFLCR